MSDRVTEMTRTGFGQRIVSSFFGVLIGFLMLIASVILLYWNEGRAVQASRALQEGERTVVELAPDRMDRGFDGKLVHVTGAMSTASPARDNLFGVGGADTIRLRRTVEMYQWKESVETKTENQVGGGQVQQKTYSYTRIWSDQPIDSANFHSAAGHQNPPMELRGATYSSNDAELGAYRIDPALLAVMNNFEPVTPSNASPPNGYRLEGDGYYRGQSSGSPAIGDIRVSFATVAAQTMSIVAAEFGGRLAPFHAANGYQIKLAVPGVASAVELLKEQEQSERGLTWILRAVGFGLMLFGFILTAGPLRALSMVLPFLGGLVGAGIFVASFLMAVPLTLVVIAIAWFAHRPAIGIGLLVVAALLFGAAIYRHRHRRPAPAKA
jgi:hypothetical protein